MSQLTALTKIFSHPFNRKKPVSTATKILFWKVNELFFNYSVLVEIVPGIYCLCSPESAYGTMVVQMIFPEFEEMNFLQNILEKDDAFFDVGANIGSWVLVAAGKIKLGHIYAFEPGPFILQNLYQNINLNQLTDRITVIDKIVSNKNGTELFVIESIHEIDHIAYGNEDAKKLYKHSSITLDTFMKSQKISRVDVVKIDVEGAEHKVLEGLRQSLQAHKVGILIVELNFHTSEFGFSPEDTLELMHSAGYQTFAFNNSSRLVPLTEMTFKNRNILNVIAVNPKSKYQKRFKKYLASIEH